MKLILAVVHSDDADPLLNALMEKGHRATRINTAGGFLREGNATVLIGVEDHQVDDTIAVIRATCHTRTQYVNPLPPIAEPGEIYMPYPLEVQVGGATIFVLNVDRQDRL